MNEADRKTLHILAERFDIEPPEDEELSVEDLHEAMEFYLETIQKVIVLTWMWQQEKSTDEEKRCAAILEQIIGTFRPWRKNEDGRSPEEV